MLIPAYIIAAAIPALILYIIYSRDLYKTGAFRFVALCFVAGAAAFFLAAKINTLMLNLGWLSRENIIRFSAPLVEEILKSLLLLYLVRRIDFTYFVDGAIYGFAAGIGFAIIENFSYISAAQNAALGVAISRVISTNLVHATASAVVGIGLGLARYERGWKRLAFGLGGYLIAILLHSFYNNMVTRVSGGIVLLFAVAVGAGGAVFIILSIRRGLKEEKRWIEEKLGDADRVTVQEAAVVQRMDTLQKVLAPLAARFGPKKAEQIEKLLLAQARLGILRKTAEKLPDPKMRKGVEDQITKLQQEMDQARRSIGAYVMLYLRNIFPEGGSPLYNRLEEAIKEKAAARPASGGPNLYAALQQRTAKPAAPPDSEPPSP